MSTNQPKRTPQQEAKLQQALKELGQLHPQEVELILEIRKRYRFGKIEIETRDGLPFDILRTVERKRLGSFS